MRSIRRIRNRRAGVLLDAVLSLGIVLVAAFVLESMGVTFVQVLNGALRFFGH
ncbi:MAG: hypothetical protein ACREDE_01390 [Thermoplasmata archaeon]